MFVRTARIHHARRIRIRQIVHDADAFVNANHVLPLHLRQQQTNARSSSLSSWAAAASRPRRLLYQAGNRHAVHPCRRSIHQFASARAPLATAKDEFGIRAGVTWLTKDLNSVDLGQLIPLLPRYCLAKPALIRTLVVLATPSLARLLDPEAFILPVMKALYGVTNATSYELDVTSVAAVVDALPTHSSVRGADGPTTAEGLAFLMSSALPGEMSTPAQFGLNDTDMEAVTLQFTSGISSSLLSTTWSERPVVRHVTLPVANTLFVNGNQSTLIADRWRVVFDGNSPQISHSDRQDLKSFQINLGGDADGFVKGGSVPLHPLTSPRRVVRSMGNVVAQIEVDGSPVPASMELEKAVMEYISSDSVRTTSSIATKPLVYALIRPPGTVAAQEEEEKGGNTGRDTEEEEEESSSILLSDLFQRARLFRVTGGGGGWGKKQGLLSLETAVDFSTQRQQQGDEDGDYSMGGMFPMLNDNVDPDADVVHGESLLYGLTSSGTVPPNSTIQFLVGPTLDAPEGFDRPRPGKTSDTATTATTEVVIGTAAAPDIEYNHHHHHQDNAPSSERQQLEGLFLPGHFGMISYGGAALGTDESSSSSADETGGDVVKVKEGPPPLSSRTRLDVPNSSFTLRISDVDGERGR